MRVRLAILEDDPVQSAWMAEAIKGQPGYEMVGEFGSVEALRRAMPYLNADVILIDIQLPDGSGLDAIRLIRKASPKTRAIVVTVLNDSAILLAAFQVGASGYILKGDDTKSLLVRLEDMLAGEVPMSPGIALRLLEHFRKVPGDPGALGSLSTAEREVLGLLSTGMTNKEIAQARGVSVPTIRSQLTSIYQQLQVGKRTEAVALFTRHG